MADVSTTPPVQGVQPPQPGAFIQSRSAAFQQQAQLNLNNAGNNNNNNGGGGGNNTNANANNLHINAPPPHSPNPNLLSSPGMRDQHQQITTQQALAAVAAPYLTGLTGASMLLHSHNLSHAYNNPHHRRPESLIPTLDEVGLAVEIVKQGWLHKQGGARGGRKSWKRRWFVLKEDCLYYKESPDSLVLLGVMPLHGCHILDLGCLTQSPPPPHNETQTVCHECKRAFNLLVAKYHCKNCGNTFCANDTTKRISIPKYGYHARVRVCDACYTTVAAELEKNDAVLKLLSLTGETILDPTARTTIQAHEQAMQQLKKTSSQDMTNDPSSASAAKDLTTPTSANDKRTSSFNASPAGAGPTAANATYNLPYGAPTQEDKKKFTLPAVNKPHLFALKNSERELWLHADDAQTRQEWVSLIRNIQHRKNFHKTLRTPLNKLLAAVTTQAQQQQQLLTSPQASPPAAGKTAKALPAAHQNTSDDELDLHPAHSPSWEIDYSAITILNKVGVGAFGEVFRARLWGTEVACKTLKTEQFKDTAALLEDLKKEVSILSQLRHPNVVLYIGACTKPPNVCIMTEWCSRGSLYDVLHDYSVHLPAKLCIDLAMGIAQGMAYLHSLEKKIIHRDLKSHNILVNKTFQVKVADFGLSHVRELQAKKGSISGKSGGLQSQSGTLNSSHGNTNVTITHKGPRHYGIFGCLRSDMMVRLANGKSIRAGLVRKDMKLASDAGDVVVLAACPSEASLPTSNSFARITHDDGTSYVVTRGEPDHTLTLQCVRGPEMNVSGQWCSIRIIEPTTLQLVEWGRRRYMNDSDITTLWTQFHHERITSPESLPARCPKSGDGVDITLQTLLKAEEKMWKGENEYFRGIKISSSSSSSDLPSPSKSLAATTTVKITSILLLTTPHTYAPITVSGNSRYLLSDGTLTHNTPEWMAPEVMEGNVYTEKIDVYSFGILLSELVTRQMPFHDQFRIKSYMDVVDAVLDQGAIPTIPKWCENLLGGIIRECVSRVPSERPNFTDLILRLREVADLEDSLYFFAFDLPRLRQLMMSSNPGIQSLAASEVAALLSASHIRRRSSPVEVMTPSSPSLSTSSSAKRRLSGERSVSTGGGGINGSPALGPTRQANISGASSNGGSPGMKPIVLQAPVATQPIAPINLTAPSSSANPLLSPASSSAINLGGLSSPLLSGPASRYTHVEGDAWILGNEDAFDFLERFTQLLSSSHREVQLHSCRALYSLLMLSQNDPIKRAQDRELVIQCGGLGSLLALLLSSSALSSAAGQVLLLLTAELTPSEQSAFIGLDHVGLNQLSSIITSDILQDEYVLLDVSARIARKRAVLQVVGQCARDPGPSGSPGPHGRKPRQSAHKRSARHHTKFVGSVVQEGDETGAETEDDDGLINASPPNAQHLDQDQAGWDGPDPWDLPLVRERSETANPLGSQAPRASDHSPSPSSPELLQLFTQLNELLVSTAGQPVPEKMSDWYSNIVESGWVLRYELDADEWHMSYALVLPDEMRLFHAPSDEPDEPLTILRTRIADPDADAGMLGGGMGGMSSGMSMGIKTLPAKIRLGHKHGLPHCFQVEDCGRIFTFCSGTKERQEKWKEGITGKKPGDTQASQPSLTPSQKFTMGGGTMMGTGRTSVPPQLATNALQLTTSSGSLIPAPPSTDPPSSNGGTAGTGGAGTGGAVMSGMLSPTVRIISTTPTADDPTLGRDIPHLDMPTPPFAKRYRDITFHGYLMLRDYGGGNNGTNNTWVLKYVLLVGTTLRVFDSHRSSPNDPWAEHEIDPEFTNATHASMSAILMTNNPLLAPMPAAAASAVANQDPKNRGKILGANEFFIRLHHSSVQFDCWAASSREKAKWLQALCADRLGPIFAANQLAVSSANLAAGLSPGRIQAFIAYYGHIDYYGLLFRRRRLTNRWMREFVCLIDSEVHYYESPTDPVDQPSGTFYIATNSGKAFHIKQSSKRPHCIGVINPSRTFYLAAETEKEYLCWTNAIQQNQRRLARRRDDRERGTTTDYHRRKA